MYCQIIIKNILEHIIPLYRKFFRLITFIQGKSALLAIPLPIAYFGHVLALPGNILLMFVQFVLHYLPSQYGRTSAV